MTSGFSISPSRRLKQAGATYSDGLAPAARVALEAMNQARAKLAGDPHLTEAGKKARLTETAKIPLADVRARQRAIVERRKAIAERTEKLARDRAPVAATDSERREALMIWEKYQSAAQRGDTLEADRLRRVFDADDPDPHTYRIQLAFQTLHPALVGAFGEQLQAVAARRLGLTDLGPEAVALAEEAELLAEEDQQLREVRAQIVRASDRAALEASGFVVKRATAMTAEERAQFIAAHGRDAFRELLDDELREAAGMGEYRNLPPEPTEPPTDGVPPTTAAPDPATLFFPAA
jgi:hypothetical protein